jgi:hypothetical protein
VHRNTIQPLHVVGFSRQLDPGVTRVPGTPTARCRFPIANCRLEDGRLSIRCISIGNRQLAITGLVKNERYTPPQRYPVKSCFPGKISRSREQRNPTKHSPSVCPGLFDSSRIQTLPPRGFSKTSIWIKTSTPERPGCSHPGTSTSALPPRPRLPCRRDYITRGPCPAASSIVIVLTIILLMQFLIRGFQALAWLRLECSFIY